MQPYDTWRRLVAEAQQEQARCRQEGRPASAKYRDLHRALLLEPGEPLPG